MWWMIALQLLVAIYFDFHAKLLPNVQENRNVGTAGATNKNGGTP
jgi:hypothetical protein